MQPSLFGVILLLTLSVGHARSIPDEEDGLLLERKELLKVAHDLEKSLNELRRLEKAKAAQFGLIDAQPTKPPQGGAMEQMITIQDWEGPLESLLQAIAQKYHYQLNIIGRKPALPILVSLSTRNKTLGRVIQDADLQAGRRAHIIVDEERTIELRYVAEAA